jgi:hypothetical protein
MDIKQIKEIKNQLISNLKESLENLISGADIEAAISDNMEILQATIKTVVPKDSSTTVYITNLLTFNINNPDNIMFSGSNRTVLKTNSEEIAGVVANNTQIDLLSLNSIKDLIYTFCLEHSLIDKDTTKI